MSGIIAHKLHWSHANAPIATQGLLKDCTLWKGPTLEQFVKNCSPWEGLMLEKFVKDCLPWEGPHAGAGEGCEESAPQGQRGRRNSV